MNQYKSKDCQNGLSTSVPLVPAIENIIDAIGENEIQFFSSLTESDYQKLVKMLDNLIDVVGEDENHILATVMDFISVLIENYEDEHVPELMEI